LPIPNKNTEQCRKSDKQNWEATDRFLRSDDALYHYTKNYTALEKILFYDSLKFGSFINSNDPFEYGSKWPIYLYINNSIESGIQKGRPNQKKVFAIDEFIKKNVHFLSFTASKNNIVGYDHPRMWAQYADNHSGVCLVFSKNALKRELSGKYNEFDVLHDYVSYQRNIINYNELLTEINNLSIDEQSIKNFLLRNKNLLFYKPSDYQDENEFRIILQRNESSDFSVPITNSLKAIILGDRYSDVYHPTLQSFQNKYPFCKINKYKLIAGLGVVLPWDPIPIV
jgi:hypothetical protein